MSDLSEKPFEATPRRIAKAKSEGNVARSSELAANLAFAAAGIGVAAIAPSFGAASFAALASAASGGAAARGCVIVCAMSLLPIGAASAAGVLASVLQYGGLVVAFPAPKIERLNPIEGMKRILSRETFAHSVRASLAFVCATAAMAPILRWASIALLAAAHPIDAAAAGWLAAREVAVAAFAVGFCFSVAEYGAARSAWLRKLRMSFDDRKREAKEEEGDAVARGRRRALHRALSRSGLRRVKDAAFVVTNPTHVAVALDYRPPRIPVPRILCRAADSGAMRVRQIARAHAVPIVENACLARALFRDGRAGDPIPHAHYVAVAEVVAALMRANAIAQ